MSTAQDLINAAMGMAGILGQGETLSANDGAFCLDILNTLIDQWAAQGIKAYTITHDSFAWGTSAASYTIGPSGASFTAARPVRIERANLILQGTDDVRIPLEVLGFDLYSEIAVPGLTSDYPDRIYYQPTYPNGTIWPWPVPTDVANELELFWWTPITEFAALSTSYSFPPGYRAAITYSAAELFCIAFGRQTPPELARQAMRARAVIERNNLRSPVLTNDAPGAGRGEDYDYRTGGLA